MPRISQVRRCPPRARPRKSDPQFHIWEIGEFGKADHIPNNRCFDLTAINLLETKNNSSKIFLSACPVCYFCDNRLVIGPGFRYPNAISEKLGQTSINSHMNKYYSSLITAKSSANSLISNETTFSHERVSS